MKRYLFNVRGMACAMCESHINDAVRNACGVKSVKSDRNRNETVVIAEDLDTDKVTAVIRALGYEAEFAGLGENKSRGLFGRRKE